MSTDGKARLTVSGWEVLRATDPIAAEDALRALDPSAAAAFVVELCELFVVDYPDLDGERLISVGVRLSHASHPAAARAALDWLEAAPTLARFVLVCVLLRGLWFREGTGQCTDDRVARLLDVHDRIEPGAGQEFCFAWALLRARRCGRPHDPVLADRLRAVFLASTAELPQRLGDDLRSLFAAE